jgi:hypothetical protein
VVRAPCVLEDSRTATSASSGAVTASFTDTEDDR